MEILMNHQNQRTAKKWYRNLTVDFGENANTKSLLNLVQTTYMTNKGRCDWLVKWWIMLGIIVLRWLMISMRSMSDLQINHLIRATRTGAKSKFKPWWSCLETHRCVNGSQWVTLPVPNSMIEHVSRMFPLTRNGISTEDTHFPGYEIQPKIAPRFIVHTFY